MHPTGAIETLGSGGRQREDEPWHTGVSVELGGQRLDSGEFDEIAGFYCTLNVGRAARGTNDGERYQHGDGSRDHALRTLRS